MEKLTPDHFAFRCPMNWDEMPASENGRYCGKCGKEVFDLSNCSIDEVIALQRRHGSICGSIRVAVAAVSLTAAACQPDRSDLTVGKLGPPPQTEEKQEVVLPGAPLPPEKLEKMRKD